MRRLLGKKKQQIYLCLQCTFFVPFPWKPSNLTELEWLIGEKSKCEKKPYQDRSNESERKSLERFASNGVNSWASHVRG